VSFPLCPSPWCLSPCCCTPLSPLCCTAGCSLQLRPYATMSPAIERTVVLQLLSFPQHDVMCDEAAQIVS